ncbi:lipopolysaccharide biosynthesis protein [Sphaerobacter thermophilus]|jgi:O-antigen/teichoic acid export membrane protein|uniref:lipopolysaccharide biosynthesis protein n=1 Tax=Sphaerobacter thermophilus TaxID=2057 RepID=UPI000DB22426|nr:MAG: hypothetical protein DIU58_05125 [Sphaerobacter thermophilus]
METETSAAARVQRPFQRVLVADAARLAPGIASELLRGFGVSLILGRYVPAAAMGVFTLFWLSQTYAAALATGWLQNAVIRFLPEDGARLPRYLGLIWGTVALTGLVAAALALALGTLWGERFRWPYLAWTVGVLCGNALYTLFQSTLRGVFDQRRYTTSAMLLAVIEVLLLLALLPRASDPAGTALMVMAVSYLPVLAWQYRRLGRLARTTVLAAGSQESTRVLLRRSVGYGLPLALSGLIVTLLQSGDRYLLAGLVSLRDLGIYTFWMSIGLQFGRGMYNLVFAVLNPRLFQLHGTDPAGANAWARALGGTYVAVFLPLVTAIGLVIPGALALLNIRSEYVASGHLVLFGLGTAFLFGLSQLCGKRREFEARTGVFVWAAGLGAAVMVVGVYLLVPAAGIEGAAIATLAGVATYCGVLAAVSRTVPSPLAMIWGVIGCLGLLATGRFFAGTSFVGEAIAISLVGVLYALLVWPRLRRLKVVGP